MIRQHCISLLVVLGAVTTAMAGDYPLTFRTVPAKDVMGFGGGSGAFGMLMLQKPAGLKKEPKALSAHPLYGQCIEGDKMAGFIFRLDASKGDAKGYDRLIVDMNRNGDLTDDPVIERVALPGERRGSAPDQELWGSIPAPEAQKIAGGRPIYYAETYLFNRDLLRLGKGSVESGMPIGQLRLMAGWYLDTTVELHGAKLKMGVYDGNSDLRLGEAPQPQTYTNNASVQWYFTDGDTLLVDADNSGKFENDVFQSKSCAFGPIVYLGVTPYKVALTANNTSLRVEPWTGPLAEVALAPRGEQVRSVTLASEQPNGAWQLIRAGAADGKIHVPSGTYRLYACDLLGKSPGLDQVMASAYQRKPQTPVRFEAGKGNSLSCGAPLQVNVTAEKARPRIMGIVRSDSKANREFDLSIGAQVVGAGGEVYSTYLKKAKSWERPPRPTFTILDSQGKKLKDGNLEYG